jgi:hypothetical protein
MAASWAKGKGINLPGVSLPIDSLTEKDLGDLKWRLSRMLTTLPSPLFGALRMFTRKTLIKKLVDVRH